MRDEKGKVGGRGELKKASRGQQAIYFVIPRLRLIAHPHLLVRVTSEWFLLAGVNFRAALASENHLLQLVLKLDVHWWPTPVSVGGL